MTLLLCFLSWAYADPEIRPAPMSEDIVERYRDSQKEIGNKVSELGCSDFAEGLKLCFRYVSGTSLKMVHEKELKKWVFKI